MEKIVAKTWEIKKRHNGISSGVLGMKQGERRKIYIHPDLAYGKLDRRRFQNLMIFI